MRGKDRWVRWKKTRKRKWDNDVHEHDNDVDWGGDNDQNGFKSDEEIDVDWVLWKVEADHQL